MRAIHTFVLRIFFDPEAPETLRGSLQAVDENGAAPFTSEQTLLALLHDKVCEPEGEEDQGSRISTTSAGWSDTDVPT